MQTKATNHTTQRSKPNTFTSMLTQTRHTSLCQDTNVSMQGQRRPLSFPTHSIHKLKAKTNMQRHAKTHFHPISSWEDKPLSCRPCKDNFISMQTQRIDKTTCKDTLKKKGFNEEEKHLHEGFKALDPSPHKKKQSFQPHAKPSNGKESFKLNENPSPTSKELKAFEWFEVFRVVSLN